MKITDKILGIIGVAVLFGLDRWSKIWAMTELKGAESINVIDGVFKLTYVENMGAAWGMLEGQTIFFALITFVVLGFVVYFYVKLENTKRYLPFKIGLVFFTAGVLGNFYERMLFHRVVDMLHFYWFEFPVFNVADVFIVVSAIFMAILVMFVYSEDELSLKRLRGKNEKGA